MNSLISPGRKLHALRRCRISSSALYCVRINILRTSELMQLDSVKSMIR